MQSRDPSIARAPHVQRELAPVSPRRLAALDLRIGDVAPADAPQRVPMIKRFAPAGVVRQVLDLTAATAVDRLVWARRIDARRRRRLVELRAARRARSASRGDAHASDIAGSRSAARTRPSLVRPTPSPPAAIEAISASRRVDHRSASRRATRATRRLSVAAIADLGLLGVRRRVSRSRSASSTAAIAARTTLSRAAGAA
jgi:hypothetical protein